MHGKKISIRLSDNQLLVLDELKDKLNCTYSLLLRAIVRDFITRNEDALERITNQKEVREDDTND